MAIRIPVVQYRSRRQRRQLRGHDCHYPIDHLDATDIYMSTTTPDVPELLREYFRAYWDEQVFRRRVIFSQKTKSSKVISSCVTEYVPPTEATAKTTNSIRYPEAILYEDWLTGKQCDEFASSLDCGTVAITDEIRLNPHQSAHWFIRRLHYQNNYMERAGHAISLNTGVYTGTQSFAPLLALSQPYYPDVYVAARDWLQLREYSGENDSRNEEITFLITENRAFFAAAEPVKNAKLCLHIGGTEVKQRELFVLGAAWVGDLIHQLASDVVEGNAVIDIPDRADKLEIVLVDGTTQVFDMHTESVNIPVRGRRFLQVLRSPGEDQVKAATEAGENKHIEFKPFVTPEQKWFEAKTKTKLLEILITVVAFSNADGGCIYVGVDDDCQVTGINQKLAEWGSAAADNILAERYAGALKAVIKDNVEGEIDIQVAPAYTASGIVVIIEVAQSWKRPVNLKDDHVLYVRNGASNRKLAPSRWPELLGTETSNFLSEATMSPFQR